MFVPFLVAKMRIPLAGFGASLALLATVSAAIHSFNTGVKSKHAGKVLDLTVIGEGEDLGHMQNDELEKRGPLFLTGKSKRKYQLDWVIDTLLTTHSFRSQWHSYS